jgi:hypothetical protein
MTIAPAGFSAESAAEIARRDALGAPSALHVPPERDEEQEVADGEAVLHQLRGIDGEKVVGHRVLRG